MSSYDDDDKNRTFTPAVWLAIAAAFGAGAIAGGAGGFAIAKHEAHEEKKQRPHLGGGGSRGAHSGGDGASSLSTSKLVLPPSITPVVVPNIVNVHPQHCDIDCVFPNKLASYMPPITPLPFTITSAANGDGAVACADPKTAALGAAVLNQGGNAFDAVITMMAAIGLFVPGNGGLLGGGCATAWQQATKTALSFNFQERAPRSFTSTAFLDANGVQLPLNVAISNANSVGVPGTVAGMAKLFQYGKVQDWGKLLGPVSNWARAGFLVDQQFHDRILANQWKLRNFSASRALFLPGFGFTPPPVGNAFTNSDYADTLDALALNGPEWFYSGPMATQIATAVQNWSTLLSGANAWLGSNPMAPWTFDNGPFQAVGQAIYFPPAPGANFTVDDMQAYTCDVVTPVSIDYHTYKIFFGAPPSSGGLTVAQTLKLVEPLNLGTLTRADAYAYLMNATDLAVQDRNAYEADAEFVNVPIIGLLDDAYVASRRSLLVSTGYLGPQPAGNPFAFQPTSTTGPLGGINQLSCTQYTQQLQQKDVGAVNEIKSIPPGFQAGLDCGCTNNISVIDDEGNMVNVTFTLEQIFGGGATLPGTGMVFNNVLTDFNFGGSLPVYPVVNFTGNTTNGSFQITGISPSTAGIVPGTYIFDQNSTNSSTPPSNFAFGGIVNSVDTATQITLNAPAVANSVGSSFVNLPTTPLRGAFAPGGANEGAAFRRPRSNLAPCVVTTAAGNPVLCTGSAGDASIFSTVAQQLVQILDFGFTGQQSTNALRLLTIGGATNRKLNGNDPINEAILVGALNAKIPSFNLLTVVDNQAARSISSIVTVDNPANPTGAKTAIAQDVYQSLPSASGFTAFPGGAASQL